MSKNKLIICSVVIVIILVIIIVILNRKNKLKNVVTDDNAGTDKKMESLYDEETGLYYLKNDITGEIITASYDENDLKFYQDNPDYNPNPLMSKSMDVSSYVIDNSNSDAEENEVE